MDPKLVDYSETSSSEEDKQTESKKIAIVQPVPQQQYAEHPSETVPESEYQQTHEPIPSPKPRELSDIPIDEIPEPEPEIILLSSDSDTVSFLTDTTLGK